MRQETKGDGLNAYEFIIHRVSTTNACAKRCREKDVRIIPCCNSFTKSCYLERNDIGL